MISGRGRAELTRGPLSYLVPFHRFSAAFLAISALRSGVNKAALAGPPLAPPLFPREIAAALFPSFGSGNGDPSIFSPIASSTMDRASLLAS